MNISFGCEQKSNVYGTRETIMGMRVCECPFRCCTGGGIVACGADGRSSLVVVMAATMARWGGSKCVRATCVFIILYLLTSLTCCRWRRRQWWYSLVNVLRVKHLLFFFSSPAAERQPSLLRVLPPPPLSPLKPLPHQRRFVVIVTG